MELFQCVCVYKLNVQNVNRSWAPKGSETLISYFTLAAPPLSHWEVIPQGGLAGFLYLLSFLRTPPRQTPSHYQLYAAFHCEMAAIVRVVYLRTTVVRGFLLLWWHETLKNFLLFQLILNYITYPHSQCWIQRFGVTNAKCFLGFLIIPVANYIKANSTEGQVIPWNIQHHFWEKNGTTHTESYPLCLPIPVMVKKFTELYFFFLFFIENCLTKNLFTSSLQCFLFLIPGKYSCTGN